MKEFKDKVAVVTGAASGIGRAIALRCAQEGMRVVLADIEEPALLQVQEELKASGASVLAKRTDVAKVNEIEALAQNTLKEFGAVHMLFNNAGVGAGGAVWEATLADWQWVIGVNLWGVIYGVRTFMPIMLAQDSEAYIVNTASIAGLLPFHPSATYQVTKHAVVALSENVYFYLQQRKSKIKISVLCPGWVNTRIVDAERNRPSELQNPTTEPMNPEAAAMKMQMQMLAQAGMDPQQAADIVFEAIRAEQFYIFTSQEFNPAIQSRMEHILQQSNPE